MGSRVVSGIGYAEARRELLRRVESRPLKYFRPHFVQRKLLEERGSVIVALGGNWSGKSYWLSAEVAGAISWTHPVLGKYPHTPMRVRVIGDPAVFREVLQPLMRRFLPRAYRERMATIRVSAWGCDGLWQLPNGSAVEWVSTKMSAEAMEGVELSILACDEPAPVDLLRASRSRLRDTNMLAVSGDKPLLGRELHALTPLSASGALYDELYNRLEDVRVYSMPIWANCKCLAGAPREVLERLGMDVSLAEVKHPDNCECNGGYKSRREIELYLSQINPLEREAREWGTWMFQSRLVFPQFTQEHIVSREELHSRFGSDYPDTGTLYIGLDPHSSRLDFVVFLVVLPNGEMVVVDELPSYYEGFFQGHYYVDIQYSRQTTRETIEQILRVYRRIKLPVGGMYIDPHGGMVSLKDIGFKVFEIYNRELKGTELSFGFRPMVLPYDTEPRVEMGLRRLRDLFSQVSKYTSKPMLRVSYRCANLIKAIQNYRYEEVRVGDISSDKTEEKFKDAIDALRYIVMASPKYIAPRVEVFLPRIPFYRGEETNREINYAL